jgi:hypothetical protein
MKIKLPNKDYEADIVGTKHFCNRIYLLRYRLLKHGKRVRGNKIEEVVYEERLDGSLFTTDGEAQVVLNQFVNVGV